MFNIPLSIIESLMTKEPPFGRSLREKYFGYVDKEALLVNNGAFGLVPEKVLEASYKNNLKDSSWPDRYRKFDYREDYDKASKIVADVIHTDHTNVALGLNVTTLINAVLRSWRWQPTDRILVTSNTYPAIAKTARFVAKQFGFEVIEITLDYPLSDQQVLDIYDKVYRNHDKVTLSIIDTISSKPGVRLPYKQLVQQAKEFGVLTLVDAAHGIGLIDFNLDELQPDFLTSDLYKWYFASRGSAFLYVHPKHHKFVHSLPTSHFYVDSDEVLSEERERTRFVDGFNFVGARYIGELITVKAASEFVEEVGGLKRIQQWNLKLARDIGDAVAKLWHTQVLENDEGTLLSSMVSVEYPVKEGVVIRENHWETFDIYKVIRESIEKKLIREQHTTAPIFFHNGKLWIRFSAQIYSELDDYIEAAKRIERGVDEFLASEAYKTIIRVQ